MSSPCIVIGATSSGVGKTSLAIGLCAALRKRGLSVQPFKVGPDFLDPTYLTRAAGRQCYNLDSFMTNANYVRDLFARKTADADIAIVEGVMGLFDGARTDSLTGSTAEIASILDAPVLLVTNTHGVARSIAPMVSGFANFEKNVRVAGVVANFAGSESHAKLLQESLQSAKLPELVGAVPRCKLPKLPSRHLGLVSANRETFSDDKIDELADAIAEFVDLDKLIKVANTASEVFCDNRVTKTEAIIKLAVARDEAFHFFYQDNLEALETAGAELAYFSPVNDSELPPDCDAIYLPGGYPELFANQLAMNQKMLEQIRAFAKTGKLIYAECGGLMYLCESIQVNENEFQLAGVMPAKVKMLERFRQLGYREVTMLSDSIWARKDEKLRGHEFHYSQIEEQDFAQQGFNEIYKLSSRKGDAGTEGYAKGNILASYMHLHWASSPEACQRFVSQAFERSKNNASN